jgi:hypothetical protein
MLRMSRPWAFLTIAATIALGVMVALLLPSTVKSHAASHGRASSIGGGTRALADAPTCAPKAGPVSATISIDVNNVSPYFTQSCYYAPANQAFTIQFANTIYTTSGNSPTSLTLVISPSQNPYRVPVSGRPGWYISSSANASFIAPSVAAPNTGTFSVQALSAGTYDLQIDEMGLDGIATLVVQ